MSQQLSVYNLCFGVLFQSLFIVSFYLHYLINIGESTALDVRKECLLFGTLMYLTSPSL